MAKAIHLRVKRDDELGAACSERTRADIENTARRPARVTCKRCLKLLEGDAEIINPFNDKPY